MIQCRHVSTSLAACVGLALAAVLNAGCDRGKSSATGSATQAGSQPAGPPWFEEAAAARGLKFEHVSGHGEEHYMPEIMGGGAALFDMDNDGDLDAYLVQSGSLTEPADKQPGNRLFRNRGDGTFEDVTEGSGADDRGYGMGVACGDVDNDGDTDLYVTNVGRNTLLRNDGADAAGRPHFTDITDAAKVGHGGWGASAAFFDMDKDGDLDLYAANYLNWSTKTEMQCYNEMGGRDYCSPQNYSSPAMDVLYRNNGDGTFTDVTQSAGINLALGTGLGVAVADFDRNDHLDVFVANDGMPNILWLNKGDGTFINEAMMLGCAIDQEGQAKAGMGVAIADVDDDGDTDLLVCNLNRESDSFFRNDGRYFTDSTALAGLAVVSRPFTRFGMGWIDFDNDGRLDLYQANGRVMRQSRTYSADPFAEPSLLKRGLEDGKFAEVLPRGGTRELLAATSRAAAFGDVDNDGGVDILVVNRDGPAYLLHNIAPQRGSWIGFRVLDEHGRDALNASISLELAGRTVTRDVRAAYSYLASNDPRIHLGLGDKESVESISVRWIDGSSERFGPFQAGQYHTVQRGRGTASPR